MRMAVERDIDALDVDTIDDFLDRTRFWPWLIVRGVALVEAVGIESALYDLAATRSECGGPGGGVFGAALPIVGDGTG